MPSKRGKGNKRQHVYRRPKEQPPAKRPGTHHCPDCGKWCYRTRDDAEAGAKQVHPGVPMHYYKCLPGNTWWHFSSMPAHKVGDIRARNAVMEDEDLEDDLCDYCPTPCDCPKWRGSGLVLQMN